MIEEVSSCYELGSCRRGQAYVRFEVPTILRGQCCTQGGLAKFKTAEDALIAGSMGEVPDFDDSNGGWRGYWVPTCEEIEEAAEPDVPDGLVPVADHRVVYLWIQMLQAPQPQLFKESKLAK